MKDVENIRKHGVSFHEAQKAFLDPRRVVASDRDHSDAEPRWFCIGAVERGVLTVRFTWRSGTIRIFRAGFWRKGRAIYDQQNRGSLH